MIKNFLAAVSVLLTMSTAQVAFAEVYVKGELGTLANAQVDTSFGGSELTDGQVFGAYIGTAVGPVRVEAGASHLSADLNFGPFTVDGSAIDYNATAYLDTASGFYVGAGADYVEAEASFGPVSFNDSGFGWHVSGGYAFAAAGGIVEAQATYLDASLDNMDISGPRFTIGYRRAL